MIIAIITDTIPAFPTYFLSPFSSLAPKRWAIGSEKPAHTPWQKPMIRKQMLPVEPTAAKAETLRKRPTIIVSIRL